MSSTTSITGIDALKEILREEGDIIIDMPPKISNMFLTVIQGVASDGSKVPNSVLKECLGLLNDIERIKDGKLTITTRESKRALLGISGVLLSISSKEDNEKDNEG